MNKTTLYLDDELMDALREISRDMDRPEAEVMRDVLRDFVQSRRRGALPREIPGIGKYRSGRTDQSKSAKRIARESVDRVRGW
jgi:hypothetical protein